MKAPIALSLPWLLPLFCVGCAAGTTLHGTIDAPPDFPDEAVDLVLIASPEWGASQRVLGTTVWGPFPAKFELEIPRAAGLEIQDGVIRAGYDTWIAPAGWTEANADEGWSTVEVQTTDFIQRAEYAVNFYSGDPGDQFYAGSPERGTLPAQSKGWNVVRRLPLDCEDAMVSDRGGPTQWQGRIEVQPVETAMSIFLGGDDWYHDPPLDCPGVPY